MEIKLETNIDDKLWEMFNNYSFKGVLIISYEDFRKEVGNVLEDLNLEEKAP